MQLKKNMVKFLKDLVSKYASIVVVNESYNLEGLNYKRIEGTDLVAILRFKYQNSYSDITKNILKEIGLVFEECYSKALEKIKPFMIGLDRIIMDMTPEQIDEIDKTPFFAVVNANYLYGANALLDKAFLRKVANKIGEDFYILPSSIHEIIVVGVSMGLKPKMLSEMVKEVNDNEVDEKERLSYHVFKFSKETDKLSIVA